MKISAYDLKIELINSVKRRDRARSVCVSQITRALKASFCHGSFSRFSALFEIFDFNSFVLFAAPSTNFLERKTLAVDLYNFIVSTNRFDAKRQHVRTLLFGVFDGVRCTIKVFARTRSVVVMLLVDSRSSVAYRQFV